MALKSFATACFPCDTHVRCLAVFFGFLYLTGHDPDERPRTLTGRKIGGTLIVMDRTD